MTTPPRTFRQVQDTLGDRFIAGMREFIETDLENIATLANQRFRHVGDRRHREAIARAFYEGRWIYKTGLALLVSGDAQSAHVRAQAYCYGTVCEGLLSDVVGYALSRGLFGGQYFRFCDPPKCNKPAQGGWKHSFRNMILICEEEGVIGNALARDLDKLRRDRNAIHSRLAALQNPERSYLSKGLMYFKAVVELSDATRTWKVANSRSTGAQQ